MNIVEFEQKCKKIGVILPPESIRRIEASIDGKEYTEEQAFAYLQKASQQYVESEKYNQFFKSKADYAITTIDDVKRYARDLDIKIPDTTLTKMEQSISEKKTSPSALANYLQGFAYEQYLQSKDVPRLSAAEHDTLKTNLGSGYTHYVNALDTLHKTTGISENAFHRIADTFFKDKAVCSIIYSRSITDTAARDFNLTKHSVSDYAERIGVKLNHQDAQIILDSGLSKEEIRKHLVYASVESYSKNPEKFVENCHQISKNKNIGLEL
jgi:hypothetical protein